VSDLGRGLFSFETSASREVPTVIRAMSGPCSFVSVIGETEVDIRVRSCEPFNVLKDETLPLVVASCGVHGSGGVVVFRTVRTVTKHKDTRLQHRTVQRVFL
jgi:hypothetical protein